MGEQLKIKLNGSDTNTNVSAYAIGRALRMNHKAFGEVLCTFTNSMGSGERVAKEIAQAIASDHPTLQQLVIGLLMKVLVEYGKLDIYTDGRNEIAHRSCKALGEICDEPNEVRSHFPLI